MKEEMSLNILIIGNGFDLAHNVDGNFRWQYKDFVACL